MSQVILSWKINSEYYYGAFDAELQPQLTNVLLLSIIITMTTGLTTKV